MRPDSDRPLRHGPQTRPIESWRDDQGHTSGSGSVMPTDSRLPGTGCRGDTDSALTGHHIALHLRCTIHRSGTRSADADTITFHLSCAGTHRSSVRYRTARELNFRLPPSHPGSHLRAWSFFTPSLYFVWRNASGWTNELATISTFCMPALSMRIGIPLPDQIDRRIQ